MSRNPVEAEGRMAGFALGALARTQAGALEARTRALEARAARKGQDRSGGWAALGKGATGLVGSLLGGKSLSSPAGAFDSVAAPTMDFQQVAGFDFGIGQR